MLQIILVQGFCPLKIKITQFPNGFRLNTVEYTTAFLHCDCLWLPMEYGINTYIHTPTMSFYWHQFYTWLYNTDIHYFLFIIWYVTQTYLYTVQSVSPNLQYYMYTLKIKKLWCRTVFHEIQDQGVQWATYYWWRWALIK